MQRREFLRYTAAATGLGLAYGLASSASTVVPRGSFIRTGLCTYLWGADMDLPTVISSCAQAMVYGVELRVQHKHGVEPELDATARTEVRKRFEDSPVTLVGFGTNEAFHYADPQRVRQSIERAKAYVKLAADCGASGVKVKPDGLPSDVAREKTVAQIARSLDELGAFAADYGQEIRLENHGACAPIPIMKEIIDQVEAKNVGLCWNCNGVDTQGAGFVENFKSVRHRLGATMHVHDIGSPAYPYDEMIPLLVEQDYHGWLLFECANTVPDVVAAMARLRGQYQELIRASQR